MESYCSSNQYIMYRWHPVRSKVDFNSDGYTWLVLQINNNVIGFYDHLEYGRARTCVYIVMQQTLKSNNLSSICPI